MPEPIGMPTLDSAVQLWLASRTPGSRTAWQVMELAQTYVDQAGEPGRTQAQLWIASVRRAQAERVFTIDEADTLVWLIASVNADARRAKRGKPRKETDLVRVQSEVLRDLGEGALAKVVRKMSPE